MAPPTLKPDHAASAIILDSQQRYLLQLRDDKPDIFFPVHWGCFGGAIDPGETDTEALYREIQEELNLDLPEGSIQPFTTLTFDFAFAGGDVLRRTFYEVTLDDATIAKISLGEGQDIKAFDGAALLEQEKVVPYDAFAIWMHINKNRIACD